MGCSCTSCMGRVFALPQQPPSSTAMLPALHCCPTVCTDLQNSSRSHHSWQGLTIPCWVPSLAAALQVQPDCSGGAAGATHCSGRGRAVSAAPAVFVSPSAAACLCSSATGYACPLAVAQNVAGRTAHAAACTGCAALLQLLGLLGLLAGWLVLFARRGRKIADLEMLRCCCEPDVQPPQPSQQN